MTVREARAALARRLAPLGESAGREARLLAEDALYRAGRPTGDGALLPDGEWDRLCGLCERRLNGEPLPYLLGEWEFYGLPFAVGPGVLIPRPDTEILVEQALAFLKDRPAARVADLCSGSGAVAVAVAANAPGVTVTAVEKESAAFGYLTRNVARSRAGSVIPLQADVLAGPGKLGPFDLLLANPPYIAAEVIDTLSPEVRHEPRAALDGGPDGLTFYRAILERWLPTVTPGGAVMAEIGFDQAAAVSALFAARLDRVCVRKDYGGNDRVVTGTVRG